MDCRQTQEKLFAYHEQTLPDLDRTGIETHLAGCVACSSLSQRTLALEKGIQAARSADYNPFISTRIMQRLDSEFSAREMRLAGKWILFLRPVAVTLALAVGVIIGNLTARRVSESSAVAATTNNYDELRKTFYISEFIDEESTLITNNDQP